MSSPPEPQCLDSDPMPRASMARFGPTAAVHVVEQVEELRPPVRGQDAGPGGQGSRGSPGRAMR